MLQTCHFPYSLLCTDRSKKPPLQAPDPSIWKHEQREALLLTNTERISDFTTHRRAMDLLNQFHDPQAFWLWKRWTSIAHYLNLSQHLHFQQVRNIAWHEKIYVLSIDNCRSISSLHASTPMINQHYQAITRWHLKGGIDITEGRKLKLFCFNLSNAQRHLKQERTQLTESSEELTLFLHPKDVYLHNSWLLWDAYGVGQLDRQGWTHVQTSVDSHQSRC